MSYAVPVTLYDAIRKVVKDDNVAKDVVDTIEKSLEFIEEKTKEQKEILKAHLKNELTAELATKADLKVVKQEIETVRQEIETVRQEIETVRQEMETVRQELKGDIRVLEWKMKLWFSVVIALILFTNKGTLEWLLKILGIIK